ncbi:MAG: helix-turn-helix domain-containing protein [Bacilli bacterium]|nr:helix-turn-helix domain-containing protein [Bacilli bacterium]
MTPRILFSDRNLSKTDIHVLGLITSLTLKNEYCYASNEYLAKYINISKRTISDSLSKLKKLKYIKIQYINNNRRIYLNTEKVPTKPNEKENNCNHSVAESCYHNINNKYNKKKSGENIPYWMEHPEVCTNEETTPEDIEELNRLLEEF